MSDENPALTDYTPGGLPYDPPDSDLPYDYDPIDVILYCDEAQANLLEVMGKVFVEIAKLTGDCESTRQELEARCTGCATVDADKAEECYSKCQQKIFRDLQGDLSAAYGYAQGCGVSYPSVEQIMSGLESGDYIGTCDYRPPVCYDPCDETTIVECDENGNPPKPPEEGCEWDQPAEPLETVYLPISIETGPEEVEVKDECGNDKTIEIPVEPVSLPNTGPLSSEKLKQIRQRIWRNRLLQGVATGPAEAPENFRPYDHEVAYELQKEANAARLLAVEEAKAKAESDRLLNPSSVQCEEDKAKQAKPYDPQRQIDWNSLSACSDLFQLLKAAEPAVDLGDLGSEWKVLGKNSYQMPSWATGIFDALPAIVKPLFFRIGQSFDSVFINLVQTLGAGPDCSLLASAYPSLMSLVGGFIAKYISPEAERFYRSYTLTSNAACPQEIPTAAEATMAFLGGEIGKELWECWTAANNLRPKLAEKVMHSQRTRPNAEQTTILWRRGKIGDMEYAERMKGNGIVDIQDQQRINQLIEAYPGFDDVIRLMVRDVFNPKVVEDYSYDQGFENNYQGKAKEYGKALGISDDLAKLFWRAHWQIPSNTQLNEMVHRLRPGRVDKELEFTSKDAERMLEINDMLPYFVKRLIAVSYRPLTRTDVQRAFFIGSVDREGVKNAYMDEGYNARDAEVLTQFVEDLKKNREAKRQGLVSIRELTGYYTRNEIGEAAFRNLLEGQGLGGEDLERVVRSGNIKRGLKRQKLIVANIKRRYFDAIISSADARAELVNKNITPDDAILIVSDWLTERETREKTIPAAKLCKLRGLKLVTYEDQLRRLVGMGYSSADAKLIAGECDSDLEKKDKAKLDKDLAKIERERKAKEAEDRRKKREAEKEQDEEFKKELNDLYESGEKQP